MLFKNKSRRNTLLVYPILKIVLSLSVILFAIFRNRVYSVPPDIVFLKIVDSIVFFQLTVFAILLIYRSIAEIVNIQENRKKSSSSLLRASYATEIHLEDIVLSIQHADIVEYEILADGQQIKMCII